MSADSVVFDMASMSEGSPSIFVKKDWLSILDNQNGSYVGNQCVIDTSQLANSNKYMNYREAYLTIPMYLTLSSAAYVPVTTATQTADYVVGLKNWYGSIVHSLTLDMNGTTIIQQTPFCGLWNTFKLMTSMSFNEVLTEGATIGFYPDNAKAVGFLAAVGTSGLGTCNNQNGGTFPVVTGVGNSMDNFNEGLVRRQQAWNFNPAGLSITGAIGAAWSTFISTTSLNTLWKSYISNNIDGAFQASITAVVYLRHLHSFFDKVPLMKGTFLRLTLNLNQSSVSFTTSALATYSGTPAINSPLGGVSPIMLASGAASQGAAASLATGSYVVSLAVGNRVLNTSQTAAAIQQTGPLGNSVILNVPAYTFNPVFESSYLSSPIKKIVYTDIYQYIVNNIAASGTFNNLITNGIANIKSVLCLPFYTTTANAGLSPLQSPFDPAGGGPTSPLCLLTQFNVQISGQNAIYNTQRYSYEQFANQLYGVNSVNAGQTEGMSSGLISMTDFEMEYNYYYVNCGRMLPVEEAVPKSVSILGQNRSERAIDIFVFVEYGVEVSVDILTGARV
jgi:hypothetical protein